MRYISPGLLQCEIQKPPVLEKALSASLLLSVSGTGFWLLYATFPAFGY